MYLHTNYFWLNHRIPTPNDVNAPGGQKPAHIIQCILVLNYLVPNYYKMNKYQRIVI